MRTAAAFFHKRPRMRRMPRPVKHHIMSLLAIVACIAMAGKLIKAVYRGDMMQTRIKPLD